MIDGCFDLAGLAVMAIAVAIIWFGARMRSAMGAEPSPQLRATVPDEGQPRLELEVRIEDRKSIEIVAFRVSRHIVEALGLTAPDSFQEQVGREGKIVHFTGSYSVLRERPAVIVFPASRSAVVEGEISVEYVWRSGFSSVRRSVETRISAPAI